MDHLDNSYVSVGYQAIGILIKILQFIQSNELNAEEND